MKKPTYIYTVLCVIAIVISIVNCKDEDLLESGLQTDMKDFSLQEAKNFFQTQGVEFSFLSQREWRAAFGGSMAPKTPVLKLNRPLACRPPASTASESAQVALTPFAKTQVSSLRHLRAE